MKIRNQIVLCIMIGSEIYIIIIFQSCKNLERRRMSSQNPKSRQKILRVARNY